MTVMDRNGAPVVPGSVYLLAGVAAQEDGPDVVVVVGTGEHAVRVRGEDLAPLADLDGGGGAGGAPTGAQYLVAVADPDLSAERVATDTTSISWDLATGGQAKAKRAALTGDVTAAADSNATTIANGAVGTAKLGGDITAAGKALLDDADAAAQRATLGLAAIAASGSASDLSAGTVAIARIPTGSTGSTVCVGNDARLSDDRTASGLRTASTTVSTSGATAPTSGQVLTATSGTAATWQTPTAGVTDHGALTGLTDDDHTQYSRADGTRAFTGKVGGIDPTSAEHLATKAYVDSKASAWTSIFKTTDESRTSTTTLANDSTLKFAMSANKTYAIRAKVYYDCNATPDIKWALTGPTVNTARIHRHHIVAGTSSYAGIAVDTAYTTVQSLAGAGTSGFIEFDATIVVFDTGGTFAFQWAQNTSNAAATIVKAGSWLEYREVA